LLNLQSFNSGKLRLKILAHKSGGVMRIYEGKSRILLLYSR